MRVRYPQGIGSEGGADIGLLLRQMWATHTAMESELRLLRQGMEYTFNYVFWAPDDERRGEQGGERRGEWGKAQGEEEERGAPEEVREGEETME